MSYEQIPIIEPQNLCLKGRAGNRLTQILGQIAFNQSHGGQARFWPSLILGIIRDTVAVIEMEMVIPTPFLVIAIIAPQIQHQGM